MSCYALKQTCVDPRQLEPAFAGRSFDHALLAQLPPSVDPCGERGEFHTFVWDGPMFARPLPVQLGEIVERGAFVFAELLPGSMADQPVGFLRSLCSASAKL